MKYQHIISLNLKWEIADMPHYKWSKCKRLFNTKTNREIRKTIVGGSIGYWIGNTFIPLNAMKNKIRLINYNSSPF
jgi:hypothetical protein